MEIVSFKPDPKSVSRPMLDWKQALFDDCASILNEYGFAARWAVIEGYHTLGLRIIKDSDKLPVSELVKYISQQLGKSRRMIYFAVQFARKFPSLDLLPEGKDVSWYRIVKEYLPEGKQEIDAFLDNEGVHEHQWERICRICKKKEA